jgi:hypothetical protein
MTDEPVDKTINCCRCGALEANYYGVITDTVTIGDQTKTISHYEYHCTKCGCYTLRRVK